MLLTLALSSSMLKLTAPTLVAYRKVDQFVPFDSGLRLYEGLPENPGETLGGNPQRWS